MDQVTEALDILRDLQTRVARIEKALPASQPQPIVAEPPPSGGIYDFKRPPVGTPRYGLGVRMAVADGAELVKRAQHGVRWKGDLALGAADEDAAWAEIGAIQAGDPEVIRVYAESGADPEMIGTALLLGLIDPIRYDAQYFGAYVEKRRALVGKTPQSWLENEFAIARGGAVVSGGDAPE
jgi:hypothetical protein